MRKFLLIITIAAFIVGCESDDINSLEFEAINMDISLLYGDFTKFDIDEVVYPNGNRPADELLHTKIVFDPINANIYENKGFTIRVNESDSRLNYDNFTFIYIDLFEWDEAKGKFVESKSDNFENFINDKKIYYKGGFKSFENIDFTLLIKGKEEGRYKIRYKFFTETLIEDYSENTNRGIFQSAILEFNLNINS